MALKPSNVLLTPSRVRMNCLGVLTGEKIREPRAKIQRNTKHQTPSRGRIAHVLLVFGCWSLSGVWIFDLGVSWASFLRGRFESDRGWRHARHGIAISARE